MLARQKNHAQAIRLRQLNTLFSSLMPDEFLRNSGEQASTVAAGPVCIHPAAMRKAFESRQRAIDNIPRARAPEMGDEAHSAGIMIDECVVPILPHPI